MPTRTRRKAAPGGMYRWQKYPRALRSTSAAPTMTTASADSAEGIAMTVRLGVNPLLWTNDDMPLLGDETPLTQCLAEAKRAGYAGVEMGRKFPTTFAELGPLLAHEKLVLASGWYSSNLLQRDADAEIEAM